MSSRRLRYAHEADAERWIAWVRLAAVPFAMLQVALSSGYPSGYEAAAWATTGGLAVGAVVIFGLAHARLPPRPAAALGLAALTFDTLVVAAFVLEFNFEVGTPVRQLFMIVIVEAALRYRVAGALAVVAASAPVLVEFEELRRRHVAPHLFHIEYVTFQVGAGAILALIVGWLVARLDAEAAGALVEARDAAALRDELGRRADTVEAINRCVRALASSLDLDRAFGAFIRELRGVVPSDRVTIVLVAGDGFETIAVAGRRRREVYPVGSRLPLPPDVVERVLRGETIVRDDMADSTYAHERVLVEAGLRSRVSAPLVVGARTIGMLSLSRERPHAFDAQEVELLTLLGRLVGTAVQNIRAYEGERQTADELRRLNALRADFVSLVSHELRSPMAAVLGAARTLQQRWRQLVPDQRDAFLALIADETDRLTSLISDVLDTSRIEAGTFSYSFSDVDVAELLGDVVGAARLAQDEVPVETRVPPTLPRVRGDRDRLRQVVMNLVDNAVKYSPAGAAVEVAAAAENGTLRIHVRDRGPGIAPDQQAQIFEKFGRAQVAGTGSKPGTGLGLFIARSIAEAHGGSLAVRSKPGDGATFTLTLPTGSAG